MSIDLKSSYEISTLHILCRAIKRCQAACEAAVLKMVNEAAHGLTSDKKYAIMNAYPFEGRGFSAVF
jgi:CO dehydrogenase/acetyl-CoA synthase alpha subunit